MLPRARPAALLRSVMPDGRHFKNYYLTMSAAHSMDELESEVLYERLAVSAEDNVRRDR
jgi:hypothetical protein